MLERTSTTEVQSRTAAHEGAAAGTQRVGRNQRHATASNILLRNFLTSIEMRAKLTRSAVANGDAVKENPEKLQSDLEMLDKIQEDVERLKAACAVACRIELPRLWDDAYRLECMLVLLEPNESLLEEIQDRLAEAEEEKVVSVPRYRDALTGMLNTEISPPTLRANVEHAARSLLLKVTADTHFTLQRKYQSRYIRNLAAKSITLFACGAFVLFLLPYLCIYLWELAGWEFRLGTLLGLPLWTALTAGLFGAFFSRLLYIQNRWDKLSPDELKDAREPVSIMLRGIVGMSGAVILFFFLQSNIVAGELFPKFAEMDLARHPAGEQNAPLELKLLLPNRQLALLIVWSFLSGFSERLVPSILSSTEESLEDAAAKKP